MSRVMCRQHGRARRRQRWLHRVTTRAGWPTGDDRQSRVRAGLLRVLPTAPVAWPGWEAAWGTLELRDERRSSVAIGLSPYGCERMVAELLLGHQTACMLPRSISGVLGDSGGLFGPPWVKKMGHGGVWVFGPHTPRTEGGSYMTSGRMPLRVITSFFRAVFCGIPSSIGVAPTWGPSKPRIIGSDNAGTKTPLQVSDPIY